MLRQLTLFIGLFFSVQIWAQTGIGTTTPNASAKLDVYATNKGFLPPRVTLTSTNDASTIVSPAEGLLVYNLGSVGLQAGYYYWNGANWATIATATSAGNGVTAMDMKVLYSKQYSAATADSTIANATGYKFTVPVSGRYLFDFSCTGYSNATISFKVRQGTTDLGVDAQTSYNNTVHVEYNGKIEVNLQLGVTYNVYVSSTGNRDNGDYDRVYYKLVAGNLPVTGQSVDYISVSRITSGQTVINGDNVLFNNIIAGNIPYNSSTGFFTLSANKTYRLSANIAISNSESAARDAAFGWKTATGIVLSNLAYAISPNYNSTTTGSGTNEVIYTPSSNINIALTATYLPNSITLPSTGTVFANIQQVGSSAIINPWTLSGTNTYNTTGNVGIGNSSPTAILDVTGTGKFSTSIINNGSRTYFGKDGANMHWFGTSDAISESNNLAYGFESNGSSIQSQKWYIGGLEKMKLSSNGYLGLGTSTPVRKLHLLTSDATSVYLESTAADNNGILILNANTNQNWSLNWHEFMFFQNQGTSIGSIVGANGGNMIAYNTSSDYRLKTDLKNYSGLDLVNAIKTYDFAWKKNGARMYGVMAHELQPILPYAVSGIKDAVDSSGKMIIQSVDYSKLTPILVKAIQEQDVKIKEQQKQIDSLLKRLEKVEKNNK